MAYIGEMQYLTIGNNTYSLPTGGEGGGGIDVEVDPVFSASPAAGITAADITNWNGKGNGTVTSVGVANATNGGLSVSGSPITSNGTITVGHSNILNSAQTTQAVYPIKIDKNGHISAYGNAVTIPTKTSDLTNDSGFITSYTDTKNTAGSTNSTSKLYLIGATEQSANPQTYSNSYLYYSSGLKSTVSSGNGAASCDINQTATSITLKYDGTSSGNKLTIENNKIEISGNVYLSNYGDSYSTNILSSATSSNKTITFPNATGTVALTSDIPTVPTKTSDLTNDSGFITSYTDEKLKWTASTSSNTYYPLQSTSTATTSTANTLNGISFYQYYNTAGGYRRLNLGNSTAYKSTSGAYGTIRLYGSAATYYGDLVPGVLGTTSGDGHISANRTWTLPDKTGTIALTSDISDEKVKQTAITSASAVCRVLLGSSNDNYTGEVYNSSTLSYAEINGLSIGDTSSAYALYAKNGITFTRSSPGYYKIAIPESSGTNKVATFPEKTGTIAFTDDIPTVPTITLNGSTTTSPSFYAPTTAGTSGYVLKSNGSGAPTWTSAILTDTKNTAGSTNSTSQLYLIGATSQAANPQTYSNVGLYFDNGINSETSIVSDWRSSISQEPGNILLSVYGDNEYSISIDWSNGIIIDGLMTPTQNTHAANKKYVDDNKGAQVQIVRW